MTTTGDPGLDWVRDHLTTARPELVEPFLEAKDICAAAQRSGRLSPDQQSRLIAIAEFRSELLGDNLAAMLGALLHSVPSVADLIRRLAQGNRSHERLIAVLALHVGPPKAIHSEVLAWLLRDKSKRLRALAADKIVQHRLHALAAEVGAARECEVDRSVAGELMLAHDLLVQGYSVRVEAERTWVTCLRQEGGTITRPFTSEEFASQAREWIASTVAGHVRPLSG